MSTYQQDAARTVSNEFFLGETASEADLAAVLFSIQNIAEDADTLKRQLFYGAEGELSDSMGVVSRLMPMAQMADLEAQSPQVQILQNAAGAKADYIHAILGIVSECGELIEALCTGKEFDFTNVVEELGDLHWYLALATNATGTSEEHVQTQNIAKLRARFPDRFTTEDAVDRDLVEERAVLEGQMDEGEEPTDFVVGGFQIHNTVLAVRTFAASEEATPSEAEFVQFVSDAVDQGNLPEVLDAAANGSRIRRMGWPEDCYLVHVPGRRIEASFGPMAELLGNGTEFQTDGHFDLLTVAGEVPQLNVGYSFTLEDLEAEDWIYV